MFKEIIWYLVLLCVLLKFKREREKKWVWVREKKMEKGEKESKKWETEKKDEWVREKKRKSNQSEPEPEFVTQFTRLLLKKLHGLGLYLFLRRVYNFR